MRIYVKSAGRKDTQDYAWIPADGLAVDKSHMHLLAKAEKNAAARGRVASRAGCTGSLERLFALFFGNIPSGRADFCGSPILNRLGLVFDSQNPQDILLALHAVADWNSADSRLESLLATAAAESNDACGFVVSPSFADSLGEVLARGHPALPPRPGAKSDLADFIRSIARLPRNMAATAPSSTDSPHTKQESSMKIFINTVPSGEDDYGWYVGGRPPYGSRLWDICERRRSLTADAAFFAALSRETGAWVLFLQDIIGRDEFTQRHARGTIAVEIPDSDPQAPVKARRLLCDWLSGGKVLAAIRRRVDTSGEAVKADSDALCSDLETIASDTSVSLESNSMHGPRVLRRIAKDRSDIDARRQEAARFVNLYAFPDTPGVHFLFTHSRYSAKPASTDALPALPAKFVVLGWRDDEPPSNDPFPNPVPPSVPVIDPKPDDGHNGDEEKNSDHPFRFREILLAATGIVVLVALVLFLVFTVLKSHGRDGDRVAADEAVDGQAHVLLQESTPNPTAGPVAEPVGQPSSVRP